MSETSKEPHAKFHPGRFIGGLALMITGISIAVGFGNYFMDDVTTRTHEAKTMVAAGQSNEAIQHINDGLPVDLSGLLISELVAGGAVVGASILLLASETVD